MKPAPNVHKRQELLHEAADEIGRRMDVAVRLGEWLCITNFMDVVQDKCIAQQQWPRDKEVKRLSSFQLQTCSTPPRHTSPAPFLSNDLLFSNWTRVLCVDVESREAGIELSASIASLFLP
jgi:hypothetical protein